ncbi:hypothetical protein LCGC14_2399630 [marine sediment metagenome]|uniref:DUF551 domain-containing protein n=1 Tax=marine sediment metagenome TaxID=412755 RepID=A0A0F9E819_9ZZZZ
MEWIKIDIDKLPEDEVLAANFQLGTYGVKEKLIGWIGDDQGSIYCESEYEVLGNCTHYIDLSKFDLV